MLMNRIQIYIEKLYYRIFQENLLMFLKESREGDADPDAA